MALVPGEYVVVRHPMKIACTECSVVSNRLACLNRTVFNEDGALLGIEALVLFPECEHEVPHAEADPVALAAVLNEISEDIARDPKREKKWYGPS